MNRRNVLNSKALKKRFCTDTNMPITVFAEPYFLERLRALDYFYGGISKFNTFCYMLESDLFSTEQDYFEYYNSVKDRAINHIKAHEEFIKFENKVIPVPQIRLFSKTELYKPENDGKVFISIDLKKANFSIMKEHCSNLFSGTWEDFIGGFTNFDFIKDSKYIRQVIFGACNPSRQIKFETVKMNRLAATLCLQFGSLKIYSVKADEIIFEKINDDDYEKIKSYVESLDEADKYRIEEFKLLKVGNYGYVKCINGVDKPELKCFNSEIIHQLVNQYLHVDNTTDDLVFYHNGQLAQFLSEVENPWEDMKIGFR